MAMCSVYITLKGWVSFFPCFPFLPSTCHLQRHKVEVEYHINFTKEGETAAGLRRWKKGVAHNCSEQKGEGRNIAS